MKNDDVTSPPPQLLEAIKDVNKLCKGTFSRWFLLNNNWHFENNHDLKEYSLVVVVGDIAKMNLEQWWSYRVIIWRLNFNWLTFNSCHGILNFYHLLFFITFRLKHSRMNDDLSRLNFFNPFSCAAELNITNSG